MSAHIELPGFTYVRLEPTPEQAVELDKWIEALRSGKFSQGKRRLVQTTGNMADDEDVGLRYCCWGVSAEITGHQRTASCQFLFNGALFRTTVPLQWSQKVYGISDNEATTLQNLNDSGATFKQISDLLEARRVPDIRNLLDAESFVAALWRNRL